MQALEDDVHINTTLTCLVTEFLGTTTPSLKSDQRDPGTTTRTGAGYGKQVTKNPAIPSICAPVVRELNNLYPLLDISQFLRRSGVPYSRFVIGSKGDCTNFALLGRCSETCQYKHVARSLPDESTVSERSTQTRVAQDGHQDPGMTRHPGRRAGRPRSVTSTIPPPCRSSLGRSPWTNIARAYAH